MRIDRAFDDWFAHVSENLAASTVHDYEIVGRVNIIPIWGRKHTWALKRQHVLEGLEQVSPGRRSRVKSVLRQVLLHAGASLDALQGVRARKTQAPTTVKAVPNLDDVARMADEMGFYSDLVWFAAGSGLRWGEIVALEPSDCERDVVSVTKSWCSTSSQLKAPKSRAGNRRVLVLPIGLEALSRRLEVGTVPLFVTEDQGARLHHSNFATEWRRAKRATQLSWRFHDLRHTYATLLIEEGVGSVALAAMLGHSRPSVTYDIYAGFFRDPIETVRKELRR